MRLIYAFITLAFFQFSWSQTEWKHSEITYSDALVQAKEQNKPIFIMLYATWCPHCNLMKSTVFSDSKVIDFLNKNYICVWKDVEKEQGMKLKDRFQTKGLPTFLFLDADETLLYCTKGEKKTDAFMEDATNALNPKMQLPYLKKQFIADPSNPDKCMNYIQTLRKGFDRTVLSEPAHLYLETQRDQQLVSETNWRIISNGVTDIESREFQFVLKNKTAFEKATSPDRVEKKIINIVSELLEPYTETLDTVGYFKKRAIAKTIALQKTDSLIFSFDLTMAERSSNWGLYQRTTMEGTEKYVWNTNSKLIEIGQVYLKNINNESALKKSIEWEKRAIQLNNSSEGNLLLSLLYLKIKDKKSALKYAQDAKAIATQMRWSTKDADAIIKGLNAK